MSTNRQRPESERPEGETDPLGDTAAPPPVAELDSAQAATGSPAVTPGLEDTAAAEGSGAPGAPLPAGLGERYTVLRRLGAGGMGVVYEAYDAELDRLIALKVLSAQAIGSGSAPELRARLLQEARSMARLSHPNVVPVYDVGGEESDLFVAMELVRGSDLKTWLEAEPHGWREILSRFLQAGKGLVAAHREGIVHRDFKPANVLVGDDDRVRVVDFGLARSEQKEEGGEGRPAPSASSAGPLTQVGSILGTPAYMAPEQHRGESATFASDQYSFCVSLWEGLTKELPYSGKSYQELVRAVEAGELSRAGAQAKMPKRIRAALLRGLSKRPEERWPSMEALLEELSRDPAATRRRALAAAALLALGGALTYFAAGSGPAAEPCADLPAFAAWNESRRATLKSLFEATGVPYAAATFQTVADGLDDYGSRWLELRTEVCRATRVTGEQSTELLDLRMACLDRRERQVGEVLDALAGLGGLEMLEVAPQALANLPRLSSCDSPREELVATEGLPDDPEAAEAVKRARALVDRAAALRKAGDYAGGLEAAKEASAVARESGFAAAIAEALLAEAELIHAQGDLETAEARLDEALGRAAEAGNHRLVARLWRELVYLIGYSQKRLDEALGMIRSAEVALIQAGPNGEDQADLESTIGSVLYAAGKLEESLERQERARELLEEEHGPDSLLLARALANIGNLHYAAGRYQDAETSYRRSLAIHEEKLGREHPNTASLQNNLGSVLRGLGRVDEAEEVLLRALASAEKVGVPTDPLASTLNNLGSLSRKLGDLDQALDYYERSLRTQKQLLGEEHPELADQHGNIARVYRDRGEFDRAAEGFRRALELRSKLGRDHPKYVRSLGDLALLARERGDHAEAIRRFRELMTAGEGIEMDRRWFGMMRLVLAELLREKQPSARAEAIALVRKARQEFEQVGDADRVKLCDGWLAEVGAP